MKDELNKKIQELCDDAGSASAAAMAPRLITDLDREYDRRVEAGMSELDAYRDILRSVDRIEAMLRALPKDTEESPREEAAPRSAPRTAAWDPVDDYNSRAAGRKTLNFYLDKASALLWVGTTLLYFLWSLTFGGWRYTWLIFLWATLGQIILSEAGDYNKHLNIRKSMLSAMSGCLWVGATILFFMAGFGLGLWRYSWLVFLAATAVQILLGPFLDDNK